MGEQREKQKAFAAHAAKLKWMLSSKHGRPALLAAVERGIEGKPVTDERLAEMQNWVSGVMKHPWVQGAIESLGRDPEKVVLLIVDMYEAQARGESPIMPLRKDGGEKSEFLDDDVPRHFDIRWMLGKLSDEPRAERAAKLLFLQSGVLARQTALIMSGGGVTADIAAQYAEVMAEIAEWRSGKLDLTAEEQAHVRAEGEREFDAVADMTRAEVSRWLSAHWAKARVLLAGGIDDSGR